MSTKHYFANMRIAGKFALGKSAEILLGGTSSTLCIIIITMMIIIFIIIIIVINIISASLLLLNYYDYYYYYHNYYSPGISEEDLLNLFAPYGSILTRNVLKEIIILHYFVFNTSLKF